MARGRILGATLSVLSMLITVRGVLTQGMDGTWCIKSGAGKNVKTYVIDDIVSDYDAYGALAAYAGKGVRVSCYELSRTSPWRIAIAVSDVEPIESLSQEKSQESQ